MTRYRTAAGVLLWYWLLVLGGLAVYSAVRIADVSVTTPVWVGAIAGTVIGQLLAIYDFKPWVAFAAIVSVPAWAPLLPVELVGSHLWLAYVPAALCGYWSLGDRGSLAAFWFPAMLWMLTILDHTSASGVPDRSGIALLGALAVAFLAFLRVREARRIALWRTTAAAPVAPAAPTSVLEEPPGRPLARGAWTLAVTALAFGVTAWLAPKLWHTESFAGPTVTVLGDDPSDGVPCCPHHWEDDTTRSRVAEYLDLGRGHDELDDQPTLHGCRVCPAHVAPYEGPAVGYYGDYHDTRIAEGWAHEGTSAYTIAPPEVAGTGVTAGGGGTGAPIEGAGTATGASTQSTTGGDWQSPAAPTQAAPQYAPSQPQELPEVLPQPEVEHPASPPPTPAAAEPPAQPAEPPPQVAAAPPVVTAPPPPLAPVQTPAPAPAPTTEVPHKSEAPSAAAAPPPVASTTAPPPRAALDAAPSLMMWLAMILGAALASQLALLALRPLRRAITLRHLRQPLWDETVDQRVSNAWQLALIGLRDAGWRTAHHESPQELARRVNVDGLDRCATILDRARHGVGIDAGDLTEMTSSAQTAYQSARGRVGPLARVLGWLRWPLT